MSDISDDEGIDDSMSTIRSCIERLSHESKKLYTNALKVYNAVEHPELDLWSEIFQLHERAYGWAKCNLVGRKLRYGKFIRLFWNLRRLRREFGQVI